MIEFILYPPVSYMLGVASGMLFLAAGLKAAERFDRKRSR